LERRGANDAAETAASNRLTWTLDPTRRLLTITLRGGVTDQDLLEKVPDIWRLNPAICPCDTVVDARLLTSEGRWSWQALKTLSHQWNMFLGEKLSGEAERKTAILTKSQVIASMTKLLAVTFKGSRYRCFNAPEPALEWIGKE